MADDKAVGEGEKKETSLAATETVEKKPKGFLSRIWNRLFRLHGDDFEKRLKYISKEEAAVLSRMSRRSLSWKRISRDLIVFAFIFEIIAVAYAILTTRSVNLDWKMRAIRVLPMFLLPPLAAACYSSFVSFMRICDRRDQKILESLRAERKAKIDELKERTNYYTTQKLIQRYDTDPAAKAAAASVLASKLGADSGLKVYVGDESNPSGTIGKSNDVELVQSSGLRNRKQVQSRSTSSGTTIANHPDQHLHGSGGTDQTQTSEYNQILVVDHHQQQSSTTQDGGWIARIAALLVGEDPTQSYALICGNCHMHNGLARKEDFPFVTYYCPHCHALNKPKQLDERMSGLASSSIGSPKDVSTSASMSMRTSDSPIIASASAVESMLNSPVKASASAPENVLTGDSPVIASASATESIITSENPVNASSEIEEVSEGASLEAKAS